jgi:hypothetical protein
VIQALELVERYLGRKSHHFDLGEEIPLDDVVPPDAQHLVFREQDTGARRVNRIGYEVCARGALREHLEIYSKVVDGT